MEEEIKKDYIAVVYSDGSAGPSNPGFIGSGVHGYIYSKEDFVDSLKDSPNGGYTITTKGYEKVDLAKNLQKVNPSFYINGIYTYNLISTNNVAEVRAVTVTIKHILSSELNITKVIFKTDSMYVLHIFRELMIGNDENIHLKPNSDLWLIAKKLLEELNNKNIKLEFIKVLGHSDVLGNIITDSLANVARYNSEKENYGECFNIIPNNKYWKPNIKKNPFLNIKYLFYTHTDRELNPYRYVIMDYASDNEVGVNDNSALFGLLYTKGQFQEIEEVLDIDKKISNGVYSLSELNLKTLYSTEHKLYKEIFGDMIYVPNKKNNGINILFNNLTNVTFQGLAKLAFNRTVELEQCYKNYMEYCTEDNYSKSEFIDITDLIYKTNEKGKRVCILDQKDKYINYNYKNEDTNKVEKIIISLGSEIIDRNTLKNIEKDVHNVYLEVIKKDKILQTNTLIITDDVIAVYTNFFTRNRII